jgi:methionyl aminopeptidase
MIAVKTKKEIEILRQGGRILARIMKRLVKEARPGISTKHLEEIAEELIYKYKAEPSFKGHQGFPASLCVSINEELVHGIPSKKRILKKGDIISLDLGLKYKGYYTDMAVTLGIGKISPEAKKLIKVTKKALKIGLKQIKPGKKTGDISSAIQKYVEDQGCSVNRQLTGHGIGRRSHELPLIPNYGRSDKGEKLVPGMVFCLEPMVNLGKPEVKTLNDGWTVVTVDKKPSAHFEVTVVVTEKGSEVLTKM